MYKRQATGVATVKPNVPFKVLISNYSDKPVWVLPKQLVGFAEPEPVYTVESRFTIGEMLHVDDQGAPQESSATAASSLKEAKPIKSMKRVARENRQEYLSKSLESLRAKAARDPDEEKPEITVDDIDLSEAPKRLHKRIRDMLRKYCLLCTSPSPRDA